MTAPGRVLDVARGQIGTVEDSRGRQKYGAAYGMDGVAWCAQAMWWCFREAGGEHLIPKTAYTPTMASWFQQRGQASKTPRVGSLVFYNFPDSLNRIQHVGIVEAVNSDGTITTLEGNTTSGAAGSQSAGGGFWRRRRSTGSVVVYGHPAYTGTATPAPAPAASTLANLAYGMRSDSRVAAFQRQSNAYPWNPALPLLEPLGNYLGQTVEVVRRAQQQMGITGADANGRSIGPRTKAALAARGFRW